MKKWLYFLVDEQGRSYKSQNNVVSKVSQPTPLPYTPDGWQNISLGWERNMNRFGIIRNFSLPLGFVKAANHILRSITLTGTVETKAFLLIKYLSLELTLSTYRFIYRFFYKGELDFTTVELQDEKSNISIMEGGLAKELAANEATVYEFDLDTDPEAIEVVTDGFLLRITANYATIPQDITANNDYFLPLAYLGSDQVTEASIQHQTSYYEQVLDSAQLEEGTNFYFRADVNRLNTHRIYGELKINNTAGINRNFGFQIRSQTTVYYSSGSISYAPGQHTITFDQTITASLLLDAPEAYFIQVIPGQSSVDIERSEIFIEYDYRYIPTNTKCFTPDVMFKKLVGKITGKETDAVSDILDLNKGLVVTSGDALRQITGSKIKTSLKDFFDSYNCWLNIGMGIVDKKIRIEAKEFFLDATATPFYLGKAKNLRVSFSADLMFNVLKTGYNVQDVSEAWGRFEFNNTSLFTTPIKKVVKEFVLISPYRTDPSGIEETRINFEGKTTTDSSNDNNVFALNIDHANPNMDGTYNLLRPAYDTILGIPTESQSSIFNIDTFTPKRILKKHGNWLRSVFYGFETDKLRFQTTQKNRELRTVLAGVTIDEDADEIIGNLAAPLFKPYYFEFDCESPVGITDALDTDPNQPFSFEWEGETYTGFLIKAGIAPDSNKEQTFRLLSTPQNDITQFI